MEKQLIPQLRFLDFNNAWESKPFKELTKINQGLQISISERYLEEVEDSYFYITNEFLKKGSNKKYFIKNPSKSVLCSEDDILMTRTGNTGMVVTNVSGAFHNNFFKITYPNSINKSFLYYFLTLVDTQNYIKRLAGTSTIPDLNHSDFYKIKFNFPKLPEQQKIAAFLTDVDELITKLTKKKTLLEQYKKGVMQKIFNQELRFKDDNGVEFPKWEEKKLNDTLELLTDFEANGSFASVKDNVIVLDKPDYAWYVRATDLEKNTNLSNVKYVNEHSYKFLKKTQLEGRELLISKRGEIGKVYFFDPLKKIKATVAPNMYLLKLNKSVYPKFLYYYFINSDGNKKLKRINASTTIGALYKNDVKAIKMKIPSLIEQTKIANFLSDIDVKIEALNTKIKNSKTFKKGLLQQMFV